MAEVSVLGGVEGALKFGLQDAHGSYWGRELVNVAPGR